MPNEPSIEVRVALLEAGHKHMSDTTKVILSEVKEMRAEYSKSSRIIWMGLGGLITLNALIGLAIAFYGSQST